MHVITIADDQALVCAGTAAAPNQAFSKSVAVFTQAGSRRAKRDFLRFSRITQRTLGSALLSYLPMSAFPADGAAATATLVAYPMV